MSTEQGLLAAIQADPDDDTPRLICADWLDDHGGEEEAARAELIRVQVALAGRGEDDPAWPALLVREREILDRWQQRWCAELGQAPASCRFARGFVEQVTMPAELFLVGGEQLLARWPITRVELLDCGAIAGPLARCPLLGRLRGLALRGERGLPAHALQALVQSPHLGRLVTLDLSGQPLGADGAKLLVHACKQMPALRELLLGYCQLGDGGLSLLAAAP